MVASNNRDLQFKVEEPGETLSAAAPTAGLTLGVASPTGHQGANPELPGTQPTYAAERVRIILGIFEGVERKVRNGKSLERALREADRRWRGKTYRTAPHRKVNLSRQTLKRIWHRWLKAGRDPRALALHYKAPARVEVPAAVTASILERAGHHDVESFSQLLRDVCQNATTPLPSHSTIERAIPPVKRSAIGVLVQARRSASVARRKIQRRLEKLESAAREILEDSPR